MKCSHTIRHTMLIGTGMLVAISSLLCIKVLVWSLRHPEIFKTL